MKNFTCILCKNLDKHGSISLFSQFLKRLRKLLFKLYFLYKAIVCIENVIKLEYFNIFSFPPFRYKITSTRRVYWYGEGGLAFKSQENKEH